MIHHEARRPIDAEIVARAEALAADGVAPRWIASELGITEHVAALIAQLAWLDAACIAQFAPGAAIRMGVFGRTRLRATSPLGRPAFRNATGEPNVAPVGLPTGGRP